MKVTHISKNFDHSSGGVTEYIKNLVLGLRSYCDLRLLYNCSNNPVVVSAIPVLETRITFPYYSYSIEMKQKLKVEDADIFHVHGLWRYHSFITSKIAAKRKIPFLISAHGFLIPFERMKDHKIKKKLAWKIYKKKELSRAKCIHASSILEAKNIRSLGIDVPIAIIPNGINTEFYSLKEVQQKTKRRILFLSRLHPLKGLNELLEVWNEFSVTEREGWELVVAGSGDEDYQELVRLFIQNNKLDKEISLVGFVDGQVKVDLLQSADVFVLPSYTESFGLAIGEAMSCGLPVITTKGTPWQELEEYKAGFWIDLNKQSLGQSLKAIMTMTDSERYSMGCNGRKLIESKYTQEKVVQRMINLYQWMLGKQEFDGFYED